MTKNRLIAAGAALVVVFLLGFLPQYFRANGLESQLRQAQRDSAGAELRDLAALAYAQANQKNFGLAADTSTLFFNRIREFAGQSQDAGGRQALDAILAMRDKITAELAKGDTAAIVDLQELFTRTREATQAPHQ